MAPLSTSPHFYYSRRHSDAPPSALPLPRAHRLRHSEPKATTALSPSSSSSSSSQRSTSTHPDDDDREDDQCLFDSIVDDAVTSGYDSLLSTSDNIFRLRLNEADAALRDASLKISAFQTEHLSDLRHILRAPPPALSTTSALATPAQDVPPSPPQAHPSLPALYQARPQDFLDRPAEATSRFRRSRIRAPRFRRNSVKPLSVTFDPETYRRHLGGTDA